MSETPKSQHSARSRAPIDKTAIKWWELYGDGDSKQFCVQNETDDLHTKIKKEDKSTSTNTLYLQRQLATVAFEKEIAKNIETVQIEERLQPIDTVVKKWKKHVSKIRYKHARKALIEALKLKFEEPGLKHLNLKVHDSNNEDELEEIKRSSNPNPLLSVVKIAVNENQETVSPTTIISGEGNANLEGASEQLDPTDRAVKKWREHVSRIRYEHARKALIKGLNLKFEEPGFKHLNLKVRESNNKDKFGEIKTFSKPYKISSSVVTTAVNGNPETVPSTIIISGEGNTNLDGATEQLDPTDRVVKKWREHVSRTRYEHARKALIKALKLKFEEPGLKPLKLKVRETTNKDKLGENRTSSEPNETSLNVGKTVGNENQEKVSPTIIISAEGNANLESEQLDSTDRAVKKWREHVSKTRYEHARKALIKALELKFEEPGLKYFNLKVSESNDEEGFGKIKISSDPNNTLLSVEKPAGNGHRENISPTIIISKEMLAAMG